MHYLSQEMMFYSIRRIWSSKYFFVYIFFNIFNIFCLYFKIISVWKQDWICLDLNLRISWRLFLSIRLGLSWLSQHGDYHRVSFQSYPGAAWFMKWKIKYMHAFQQRNLSTYSLYLLFNYCFIYFQLKAYTCQ